MDITVIITTYNWPEALRLSLKSVLNQIVLPMEIIVADDGSGKETAQVIESIADQAPVPVIHSRQADKGFRLAKSRNKAIARASGEYIILIDGDILMEEHFIHDHRRFARPGMFIQGSRVLISEKLSVKILQEQRLLGAFCALGVENKKNCIRSWILASLFSFRCKNVYGVRTCNFAFWRKDALAVNGFNEDFVGWGREDSEFTARLIHQGLVRRNLKFNALAYHLHHSMNDRSHLKSNDRILEETLARKAKWCEKGISQYLE